MTRFQKIMIALVAVLIVVVAAGAIAIVRLQVDAAETAQYHDCLARRGFSPEKPTTTNEELEQLIAASEACTD